ncbi:hypothetical protein PR048_012101 [Dryococelus australis]|uniref:Uncharacterized protein n=1 Tax=Dryococelus australis TaxID=614101 RepID=A0ABQ9HNZ5_9NEOP|nr:hypothetical protein PR048_012101 [Dryococelus australis]
MLHCAKRILRTGHSLMPTIILTIGEHSITESALATLSKWVSLLPPSLPLGGVTPGFSYVGIVPDDAAVRRVLSGISRFPRPVIPALLHTHLASPSPALKSSLLRAAQISSLTHTIASKKPKTLMPGCTNSGGKGDPLENPLTSVTVRHDSHMRKSGIEPGSLWWEASTLTLSHQCPSLTKEARLPYSPTGQSQSLLSRQSHFTTLDGHCVVACRPELHPCHHVYWTQMAVQDYLHTIHRTLTCPRMQCCHGTGNTCCGSAVVRILAYHLGEPGLIPSRVTRKVRILLDDAPGRRVFSMMSRFPQLFISGVAPYQHRFILPGSQNIGVNSRPYFFTRFTSRHREPWFLQHVCVLLQIKICNSTYLGQVSEPAAGHCVFLFELAPST